MRVTVRKRKRRFVAGRGDERTAGKSWPSADVCACRAYVG